MPLFDPDRHERLTERSWDAARAREAIERIVADCENTFDATGLWPIHPIDVSDERPGVLKPVYYGAAGVIWALGRLGAQRPAYAAVLESLGEAVRRETTSPEGTPLPGFLLGEAGILMLRWKLAPSEMLASELHEALAAHPPHPAGIVWGSAGSALAALHLFRRTDEQRWRDLWLSACDALWDLWELDEADGCHLFTTELYGHTDKQLGGLHGLAATLVPFVQGRDLLPSERQRELLERVHRVVSTAAQTKGGFANWPFALGPHTRPISSQLVLQQCMGAPGIVSCLGELARRRRAHLARGSAREAPQPVPRHPGQRLCPPPTPRAQRRTALARTRSPLRDARDRAGRPRGRRTRPAQVLAVDRRSRARAVPPGLHLGDRGLPHAERVLMRRRFWMSAVSITALLAFGFIGYHVARRSIFYPGAPEARYPQPRSTAEARRQDLEYLRAFFDLDRSFTPETRQRAHDIVDELAGRAAELDEGHFEFGVARALAQASNGHTGVWTESRARRLGRVSLQGYPFADGYYVVRATGDLREWLGARMVAVEGTPWPDVEAALRPLSGANDANFEEYVLPRSVEVPALLYAAGVASDPVRARYSLERDGRIHEVTLARGETGSEVEGPRRHELLAPAAGSHSILDGVSPQPVYLREPTASFRQEVLADGAIHYVQYRRNHSTERDDIDAFNADVLEMAERLRPRLLIVDQRFNYGGDYTKTYDVMTRLPDLIAEGGRIYVVTGGQTMSAGINSVAFLKAAGGERVTIIGTRIGDLERSYGESNPFVLPNSGIGMTFATGLHDVADGCWERACYWSDFFYNVAAGSLDPDIVVDPTFAEYAAGRDMVLETILRREGLERADPR
jgi:hypothetical protein